MEKQKDIRWPKLNTINKKHGAILISLGGASRSTPDGIMTFARDNDDDSVYKVWGTGHTYTISREICKNIVEVYKKIKKVSKIKRPKVIMIGKSMGGCKLHKAANKLYNKGINIDLFVGVDVSCSPSRHYDKFIRTKGDDDGLFFEPNVLKLFNFYQTKEGERQKGHPLLFLHNQDPNFDEDKYPYFNKDFNIDVFKDKFSIKNLKPSNNGKPLSNNETGHKEIDTLPDLLLVIKKLVIQALA